MAPAKVGNDSYEVVAIADTVPDEFGVPPGLLDTSSSSAFSLDGY